MSAGYNNVNSYLLASAIAKMFSLWYGGLGVPIKFVVKSLYQ